ncbi:hypothetical protein ACPA54_22185 [Uniformispora flossi]|uniref:hypothetical protein n=1 Tax=Uniformispora flossi TaxID=3390723 RepID=UPI003C2E289E
MATPTPPPAPPGSAAPNGHGAPYGHQAPSYGQQPYAQPYPPQAGMPGAQPAHPVQPAQFGVPGPAHPHFGRILLSEWTKIRTVRSTTWTLLVMAAIIIGMAAIVGGSANPNTDPDTTVTLSLIGVMIAQIAAASLGVLTISAEYTTGMIRSTLTAYPRRVSVLAAKAVVFAAIMFVVGLVSCTLAFLLGDAMMASDVAREPTNSDIVRGLVGSAVYLALIGLFSLGIGTMLRHSAGAITTVLGLILLPSMFGGFVPGKLGEAISHYNPMNLLLKMIAGAGDVGGKLEPWPGMLLMAAYAGAALLGGAVLLRSRDV